ncbi:hypothetical protein [Candidatus Chlorohelix sp.]|uniref:hypothetical protein n=1 Tax=Candidatus Chlorohelix sp. TaxID=3139201 RepID=UPI0030254A21
MSQAQSPSLTYKNSVLTLLHDEFAYLKRGLGSWVLHALLLFSATLFTLAYQIPQVFEFALGITSAGDNLYAQSFNQPESNNEFSFRWSSDESRLRFYGYGRVPSATLIITMAVGGRPAALAPAKVQVWHEQTLLGEVKVGPGNNPYRFDYSSNGSKLEGDLIFTLRTLNPFPDKTHNLPLGVVVSKVRLEATPTNGRPIIPSLPHLAMLLTILSLVFLWGVRAGWSERAAGFWGAGLALALAIALGFYRPYLMPPLTELWLNILLAYPLLVLGLRVTARWIGEVIPTAQARWLGLLFCAVFVIKAAGLNHPAFSTIDHWFRIHQILRFWENPGDFWNQYFNITAGKSVTGAESGSAVLGQWGINFTLPYSPLFYLFAAPLALIFPGHNPDLYAAVNCLAAWLEASQLFLIYIIARQAYGKDFGGRAGVIAAGLLGFYPLSYLLFSDGGYNSMLAHWLTLIFFALLLSAINSDKVSNKKSIVAGLALGFALLAHTSTFLLLGTLVIALFFWWLARPETRNAAFRLAIIGSIGFGLALALYYGFYLFSFLTVSLPALLEKLGSSGSIGQTKALLGKELLSGFFPQLWVHFRLIPFLLALVGIVTLLPYRKKEATPFQKAVYGLWAAWLAIFLLFALVDLRVNLLQKHMLFAAPLLCLLSGFALVKLSDFLNSKNRAILRIVVPTLSIILVVYLAWEGLVIWYSRVFYYILPPGSG